MKEINPLHMQEIKRIKKAEIKKCKFCGFKPKMLKPKGANEYYRLVCTTVNCKNAHKGGFHTKEVNAKIEWNYTTNITHYNTMEIIKRTILKVAEIREKSYCPRKFEYTFDLMESVKTACEMNNFTEGEFIIYHILKNSWNQAQEWAKQ